MRTQPEPTNDALRPEAPLDVTPSLLAFYRWGASIEPNNAMWREKLAQLEREANGEL